MRKNTLYRLIEQVIQEVEIGDIVASGEPEYLVQAFELASVMGQPELYDEIAAAIIKLSDQDFLDVVDQIESELGVFSEEAKQQIDEKFDEVFESFRYANNLERKFLGTSMRPKMDTSESVMERLWHFIRNHAGWSTGGVSYPRNLMAQHPKAPIEALEELSKHYNRTVATAARKNLATRKSS